MFYYKCMNGVNSVPNNNNMISYKAANLGVLAAPDSIGKVQLYSDAEAEKLYKEMSNDIYTKQSKVSPGKSYKTPKPVYYIGGAAVLTFLWTVCKKLIKK